MRPGRLALAGLLSAALGLGGCARTLYNFGTVESERIYRSAQPSPLFLRYLVWRHDVRTLVNLRGRTPGFESAFAARRGLALVTLNFSASRPPSEADVAKVLAVLRDPARYPVLVHCRNGVDRTGFVVGLYRTLEQGWTPGRALAEMSRYFQFETLNSVPKRVVRDDLRTLPPR